jgi:hypothetical protein
VSSLSQYVRFDNDGVELVINLESGESLASLSGYARMAGLSVDAISKRVKRGYGSLDKVEVKEAEIQTKKGLRTVYLLSEETISRWIIQDNPELAFKMLQAGVRVYLHSLAGYTVSSRPGEPYWYKRLKQYRKDNAVPNGYFSIYEETLGLVADLEEAGCVLPDNAVPDISIGMHWANHLKDQGVVIDEICVYYPHTYPGDDGRGTRPCKAYPESMLPTFRQWFRDTYKPRKLPEYVNRSQRPLIPFVAKLLGISETAVKMLA